MKVKLRKNKYYARTIDNQIYLYKNIIYYFINKYDPISTVLYRLDNKDI